MKLLMIPSGVLAAMAYQAGFNPPGCIWQDDADDKLGDNGFEAGTSIMSYHHPSVYLLIYIVWAFII